ncbi:MAG: FAD-binding protein, partial [Deltaproteobacteria bacterium]|nr:FAD-binding protein [Deltaproteobacteria bacterium]
MTMKMMDCDLVVLGAGGSGLVAGCRAFDLTGKKVVILEKAPKPAGCTYFASRMGESGPIVDSKWQKDAGYEVNEDPQDLSGQFFDWLVTATKGEAEKFFYVSKDEQLRGNMGGAGGISIPDRYEKYKDLPDHSIGPGRMGSWMVDHLSAYCKKVGIQLLTSTRARKFITDDKGKVTTVVADTNDGQLLVNCKACVIAAGGWGANKELLRKYYPESYTGGKFHSLCPPYLTGDCILAAEEIGAYIDPTIRSINFPGGFFGDGMARHPWNTSLQRLQSGKAVVINLDGKRWNGGGGMGGSGGNDGYIGDQRDGVGIAIVDSDIVEAAESQQDGMQMGGSDPRTLMEDLEYEAAIDEAGASGNHTKKADSLVELALKMKVDPRALVDTIERYNKFCETGKDLDFGKSAQNLQKIQKPPFYAIYGHRWTQSTKGRNGICVNSEFQALNAKGETLPGLWAAGDGCTIFGGFVIGSQTKGVWNEEETAARTKLSRSLAQAAAVASGKSVQDGSGPSSRGQGGDSTGGGGQGGMMMGGGSETNILEGKGSPCG